MNVNSPEAYWLVVQEDQNNVLVSTSNFPVQDTEVTDTADSGEYIEPIEFSIEDEPQQTVEVSTRSSREDPFWDKNKTRVFLSICADNKYRNWDPKDKEMWNEIAPVIGTTPDICYRKYLSLKSNFVRLYKRKLVGKNVKWFCYSLCEEVFKDKFIYEDLAEIWDDIKIRKMLVMYMELFNKFNGNAEDRKQCWRQIARSLGTTEFNCIRKFTDLRRIYIDIFKKTQSTGKTVKWPYLSFFQKIFREGIRFRDKWDKQKVKELLTAFIERTNKFADSNYTKKDLWKEISSIVDREATDCVKKFWSLKSTYMRLKVMENSGQLISNWRYYKYFEEINHLDHCLNEDDKFFKKKKTEGDENIIQMLEFYIQNKDKFMNPLIPKKSLWKIIGPKINLNSAECDRKFRNLKHSYVRVLDQQSKTGKAIQWPYYSYFEQICDKTETLRTAGDKKIIQMLEFYIQNKDKFMNPLVKKKNLWKIIGRKLKLNSDECDRKFRNLKHSYVRIVDQQGKAGKAIQWPYFSYFEKICDKTETLEGIATKKQKVSTNVEDVVPCQCQVKKLAGSVQDCQDMNNKFERLIQGVEESNNIQRERNKILWALLDRHQ